MEIILLILIVILVLYFNNKINKIAISIGELSDKQTEIVVEFFVSKLQEKGILNENEVDSLYQDINQKIKSRVKLDIHKDSLKEK